MPTEKEEFILMKVNPRALYDIYIEQMMEGLVLTTEQVIKFEYLKKILLIQE